MSRRFNVLYGLLCLCSILHADAATGSMADTVKQVIEQQPKLIYDALIKYRQLEEQRMEKEASQAVAGHFDEVFSAKKGVILTGNTENPKVVIAEFFDYNCGACRSMIPVMHEVLAKNPDVLVVSRPLPMFGEGSRFASQMAYAAKSFSDTAYQDLSNAFAAEKRVMDKNRVSEIVKANRFSQEWVSLANSPDMKSFVEANQALAITLNLAATPMFYIAAVDQVDSVLVSPGAMSEEVFSELIDAVRQ